MKKRDFGCFSKKHVVETLSETWVFFKQACVVLACMSVVTLSVFHQVFHRIRIGCIKVPRQAYPSQHSRLAVGRRFLHYWIFHFVQFSAFTKVGAPFGTHLPTFYTIFGSDRIVSTDGWSKSSKFGKVQLARKTKVKR